jgi:hypothetical protein
MLEWSLDYLFTLDKLDDMKRFRNFLNWIGISDIGDLEPRSDISSSESLFILNKRYDNSSN